MHGVPPERIAWGELAGATLTAGLQQPNCHNKELVARSALMRQLLTGRDAQLIEMGKK